MRKSMVARFAVVAAAASAMLLTAQGTALADTNKIIYLPDGRGYMKFIDDGDVFEICDTRVDDRGVTGTLKKQYLTGNISELWSEQDGGDAGCDKHPYNIGNDGWYQMKITWNGGGSAVYSGWFNE